MIDGLINEYRFEYHDDDDDDMVFIMGVDEENKLKYCRYVVDEDDKPETCNHMSRVANWDDFFRLRYAISFLPEEKRESTIRDVLNMFGEDIYKVIEEVIKKR